MNANCELLTTNFAPAFEVPPARAISRAAENGELEKLKARLLREKLNELAGTSADGFIRRAANEAAALAWETRFPLLLFPALFEEKARAARAQMRRQLSVRHRSLKLLPVQAERSNLHSVLQDSPNQQIFQRNSLCQNISNYRIM